MFDCKQKKIEMALKAAEKIRHIVPLIRTLESGENTSDLLDASAAKLNLDVEALISTVLQISNDEIKEDLENVYKKYSTKLEKQFKESEEQTKQLRILEDEINEYLAYTKLFYYVGEEAVATELLKKATAAESTEQEFYACILLLLNDKADLGENFFSIAKEMAADVSDRFKKHILMNMDEMNQNEICRYIRQG